MLADSGQYLACASGLERHVHRTVETVLLMPQQNEMLISTVAYDVLLSNTQGNCMQDSLQLPYLSRLC